MYSQIDPALFFARDVATRHQTQSKAPVATAPCTAANARMYCPCMPCSMCTLCTHQVTNIFPHTDMRDTWDLLNLVAVSTGWGCIMLSHKILNYVRTGPTGQCGLSFHFLCNILCPHPVHDLDRAANYWFKHLIISNYVWLLPQFVTKHGKHSSFQEVVLKLMMT